MYKWLFQGFIKTWSSCFSLTMLSKLLLVQNLNSYRRFPVLYGIKGAFHILHRLFYLITSPQIVYSVNLMFFNRHLENPYPWIWMPLKSISFENWSKSDKCFLSSNIFSRRICLAFEWEGFLGVIYDTHRIRVMPEVNLCWWSCKRCKKNILLLRKHISS